VPSQGRVLHGDKVRKKANESISMLPTPDIRPLLLGFVKDGNSLSLKEEITDIRAYNEPFGILFHEPRQHMDRAVGNIQFHGKCRQ
jgi:hypothetical protein